MRIGLFGSGAYGIALSSILSHNRHEITMWTKHKEEKDMIEKKGCNEKVLPE